MLDQQTLEQILNEINNSIILEPLSNYINQFIKDNYKDLYI